MPQLKSGTEKYIPVYCITYLYTYIYFILTGAISLILVQLERCCTAASQSIYSEMLYIFYRSLLLIIMETSLSGEDESALDIQLDLVAIKAELLRVFKVIPIPVVQKYQNQCSGAEII